MAKSKRIELIAQLTKNHHTVLDIGTDHGYVLKLAFDQGFIQQAIAADLREKPLKQAESNLKNYPVTYQLSDGFLAIKKPFDMAIIAGMGAYLICDIMEHAPQGDITYILQANEKTHVLRAFLATHGFNIIDEYVVHDRFFYVVLKVKRGHMQLSEADLFLGPILKTKSESTMYYRHKMAQIDKIIHQTDDLRKEELLRMRQIYQSLDL